MKAPSMAKIDINAFLDDFRNLNPKDVGAWPLAPRVAVLIGIFVAALVAGWWFVWNDQLETLETRQADELKLKDEFVAKKKQSVNLALYTQQLSEIDRSFGALLKQLPDKSEVESLLIEINQSGMGRGLQFELFKPGQEVSKDFYAELPINVRITGSYHDFGAFAGDIGRLSRITKTFRYLDEEELAAKKKAAQAAKGQKK